MVGISFLISSSWNSPGNAASTLAGGVGANCGAVARDCAKTVGGAAANMSKTKRPGKNLTAGQQVVRRRWLVFLSWPGAAGEDGRYSQEHRSEFQGWRCHA